MMIITTPSGKSPFVLESLREEDIIYWVKLHEKITGNSTKGFLSLNAVKYWVRDFYQCNTPEWKFVQETIDRNLKEFNFPKVKTFDEIMNEINRKREEEDAKKKS